jgi:hypothetical protein
MEKKRVNVDIDVEGAGSVFVHKAVQQMLFDKGFAWGGSGVKLEEYGSQHHFYFEMNEDGSSKKMWQKVILDTRNPTIKATDILSGAFDLNKWIRDSISKKEPDNVVYCVDLTWVKGEAREVLSTAIQKKAFEKGYKWRTAGTTVTHAYEPGLFFDTRDKDVCFGETFEESKKAIKSRSTVEISVNKALRGEYRSVK